jgi:hypothetical protein
VEKSVYKRSVEGSLTSNIGHKSSAYVLGRNEQPFEILETCQKLREIIDLVAVIKLQHTLRNPRSRSM